LFSSDHWKETALFAFEAGLVLYSNQSSS